MVVPSKHRDALAMQSEGRLTLTLGYEGCLWLIPGPQWEITRVKVAAWPPEARPLMRVILGNATEVEMDSAGRVLISPELRSAARIKPETKVMLVGMGSHFEVWDAAEYEERQTKAIAAGLPASVGSFI